MAPNPSIPLRPAPATVQLPQAQWPGGGGAPSSTLGRVEEGFKGAYGGIAAIATVCGIGAILCVVIAASLSSSSSAGGLLAVAGILAVICILTGINASSRSQSHIDLHEHGLIITSSSKTEMFRYDDVKNVWYRGRQSAGSGAVTTSLFNLELNNGSRFAIEAASFINENELANALLRKLTASLLVKALLDLQAGKRLSFGAIQVDRVGVSNGRETVPWSEVSGVRASGGNITINRQGKWLSWAQISTERTPNVLVLLVIADAIKGVKVP